MNSSPSAFQSETFAFKLTAVFFVLSPLMTYGLLVGKGLPSFATGHFWEVLIWVYSVTWLPALFSGLLVSGLVAALKSRVSFFVRPYDFGRCFSLGAVSGALAQAASTWAYRALSHRPFSSFWIAGAMISGALAGALVISLLLYRESKTRGAGF